MSKQLKISASLSLIAMLGLVLTASPATAGDLGLAASRIDAMAGAYTSRVLGDLLPLLQPGLQ